MSRLPSITLASASPRRRLLLARLGVPFDVRSAYIDERPWQGEAPSETAERVALAKAEAVASTTEQGIILGADTVVVLKGAILGKPKDQDEALHTLRLLRGRMHCVVTGIAALNLDNGRTYVSAATTRVWMRRYTDRQIAAYVASGDPYDKAGAYAIQNNSFRPVTRIEGCYFNVVGLPLCEVAKGLVEVGYPRTELPIDRLEAICPHDAVIWE